MEKKEGIRFKGPSQSAIREHNILLVGASGAGKSLLVNCIPNYLKYADVGHVVSGGEPMCLIPVRFTVTDDSYKPIVYELGGNDGNERLVEGQSCTRACKCYEFTFGDFKIRLIDSPGVGSTEGPEQDVKNMENVLETMGRYENIDFVAIVMHADQTLMSVDFKACLKTIFTHLHKSAVPNLLFILTHSESCDYKPSKFLPTFQMYLKELKESCSFKENIELDKRNIYCVDNKGFRYLVTTSKSSLPNESPNQSCVNAWAKSASEVGRLLHYVTQRSASDSGRSPNLVDDTLSINDAKQFIHIMEPILADITSTFKKNEVQLKRLTEEKEILDGYEVKAKTFFIKRDLWVCQSEKCQKAIVVDGEAKVIYPKLCCEASTYRWVAKNQCSICGCDTGLHLKVLSDTRTKDVTPWKYAVEKKIEKLNTEQSTLTEEKETIMKARTLFKDFNTAHAIILDRDVPAPAPDTESVESPPDTQSDVSASDTQSDVSEPSVNQDQLFPDAISKMKLKLFSLTNNGPRIKSAYDKAVTERNLSRYTDTINVEGVYTLRPLPQIPEMQCQVDTTDK